MTDHYEALGIKPTASPKEISTAYKALVSKYHPDKHEQNELKDLAEEKLQQLNGLLHGVQPHQQLRGVLVRAQRKQPVLAAGGGRQNRGQRAGLPQR